MSRLTAKYLALLALAVIAYHWKTLLTDQYTMIVGYEGVNQMYAWLHEWLRDIGSGRLPFWDPNSFAGRPFTEEMTAFYPFHLLFALVPLNKNGLISPHFFHEYVAFNRFLGGCLMFALLRELKRSHFASFIGACAFCMGGVVAKLPWPQYMEACIWMPGILLFIARALRTGHRGRALLEAALAGVCLGMAVLAGGMQFALMQGICVAGALVYFGATSSARTPGAPFIERWGRPAALLGIFAVTGFCLGAVQILPSMEYGKMSLRAITGGWFPTAEKIPYDRLVGGMWPGSIISSVFPSAAPIGAGEPWSHYVGVFPMFMVVVAIWKRWNDRWVRFLAVMALVVFAYTLGEFSPLFGFLYAVVPYLWMVRGASRFVYLITCAQAVLCAYGLDSLLEGAGRRELWAPARPFLKWIAIVCAAFILIPGLYTQISLNLWTCLSLVFVLASCAWCYRISLRPISASLFVLLAGFVLFDLGAFNWLEFNKNQLSTSPEGDHYVSMVTLRPAIDFLKPRLGMNRAYVPISSLPNIGDVYGTPSIWGGGATVLKDFQELRAHEDLLNVRYRIRPTSTPDPGEIYRDSHWKIYDDKTACPRGWLVHQIVRAGTHEAAWAKLNDPAVDHHTMAVIEQNLPHALDPASQGDSVNFRAYDGGGMTLAVKAAGSALLVLSENYYPGWHATINNRDAEIYRVDGGLRGILVPRGASIVSLSYDPLSFYLGGSLTLAAAAGVLIGLIRLRRVHA